MTNRWGNNGNSERLYLGGDSKITADGDFSHEIKRHLLLRRKATTNLKSILKCRDITLPTKVHLVKAMVFPVVMYGCEGNRRGNSGNSVRLFWGATKSLQMVTSAMKLKDTYSLEEKL